MSKLNPDALAECGDPDLDVRAGVQPVTTSMILRYVTDENKLPLSDSARLFAEWLYVNWNDFNEDGKLTNSDVISGALIAWRGQ